MKLRTMKKREARSARYLARARKRYLGWHRRGQFRLRESRSVWIGDMLVEREAIDRDFGFHFQPTDAPGLRLWFQAADGSVVLDSGKVTQWRPVREVIKVQATMTPENAQRLNAWFEARYGAGGAP